MTDLRERLKRVYGSGLKKSPGWKEHVDIWGLGGLAGHLVGEDLEAEVDVEDITEEEQVRSDTDNGNSP